MKRAGDWWVPDAERLQLDALAAGGWQLDRLRAALDAVGRRRVAVDGGAHVGTWAKAMAEQFGWVHAFEPAPDTFACLRENLANVHNATIYECALGAAAGWASLADDAKFDGGNTGGRHLVAGAATVPIMALDELDLKEVDFLKLDVEGYELPALEGARATIARCRPVVFVESKPRMSRLHGIADHAALALLKGIGYREVGRAGSDHWLAPT